ncbi:MAG: glycosyltransferase [Candidatus Nanoarchaeia archaeon]|nr:glycosyltransferase [Candidatus Nanoarchaeia archaeon]
MVKLSAIIPAYNEGKKIYSDMNHIIDSLDKVTKDFEIILVNDGSKDNTLKEVSRIKDKRIKVKSYEKNMGKGYALKYGVNFAKGKYISFMDADLDINPNSLKNFFKYMEFHNADIIIGSKRHPQSQVHYPILRKILSRAYQTMIYLLFRLNVSDTQSGLKLLKTECAKKLMDKVTVKKYAFDLELLVNAKRNGYKVVEAPIVLDYKFNSTVNFKAIWGIFVDTLGVAYRTHILRYYDKK